MHQLGLQKCIQFNQPTIKTLMITNYMFNKPFSHKVTCVVRKDLSCGPKNLGLRARILKQFGFTYDKSLQLMTCRDSRHADVTALTLELQLLNPAVTSTSSFINIIFNILGKDLKNTKKGLILKF